MTQLISLFLATSLFLVLLLFSRKDIKAFLYRFGLQVNEIYHDESLGVHINVVLVRMIMLGYAKVSFEK